MKYEMFPTPEGIKIGCRDFTRETIKEFFYWYFNYPNRYRFLLWDSNNQPLNVYRIGNRGDAIKVYVDNNPEIFESSILDSFYKVFQ